MNRGIKSLIIILLIILIYNDENSIIWRIYKMILDMTYLSYPTILVKMVFLNKVVKQMSNIKDYLINYYTIWNIVSPVNFISKGEYKSFGYAKKVQI